MPTYGPGENAFNFNPVEEGGDRTNTAFAKTKAQLDALYENLNRDIPGVYPSMTVPKPNGTPYTGAETNFARGDHQHPLQKNVSGNAGTANKWKTARELTLTGAVSGSVKIDGSKNATLNVTSNVPLPFVPSAGGKLTGTVAPKWNNTVDLGTETEKFRAVFAQNFVGALSGAATKANYSNAAGRADRLSTVRRIRVVGQGYDGGAQFDGTGDVVINLGCSGCIGGCKTGCSSCTGGCSSCTGGCSGACTSCAGGCSGCDGGCTGR